MLSARDQIKEPFPRVGPGPGPGLGLARRGPVRPGQIRVVWPDMAAAPATNTATAAAEPGVPAPEPPPPVLYAEEEVARLCAEAASTAAAEAEARVRAEVARAGEDAAARLADSLATLAGTIEARREGLRAEAVPIAAALGRLIAYEAVGADPLAAAEAVAAGLLAELRDEPEVAVEVAPKLVDELRPRLAALVAGSRLADALEVRAGAGLRAAEVRVLWRDGWAERSLARLESRAADALAALAGNGAVAAGAGIVVEDGRVALEGVAA